MNINFSIDFGSRNRAETARMDRRLQELHDVALRYRDEVARAKERHGIREVDRISPVIAGEYYQFLPKLSLPQIRAFAYSWMQGNFTAAYDLTSIVLDTWPECLRVQHECRDMMARLRYVAYPFHLADDDPTPEAERRARYVNECLASFDPVPGADECGWHETVYDAAGALIIPSISEILWEDSEGDWWPRATAWCHPRLYGFDKEGRLSISGASGETTSAVRFAQGTTFDRFSNPIPALPEEARRIKFIYSVYRTRSGACTMSGKLRPLLWWWGAMVHGREWLLRGAEMFGQPTRIAYYSPNMASESKLVLDDRLRNWGALSWMSLPDDVRKIDFFQAKDISSDSPQRFFMEHGDRYVNLMFHGTTMTARTERGEGGSTRGNAATQMQSRTEVEEGYAAWSASIHRRHLVRYICERNFGDAKELPFLETEPTTTPKPLEQAQVLDILLNHYEMDADDASEITGFPLVESAPCVEGEVTPEPHGEKGTRINGHNGDLTTQTQGSQSGDDERLVSEGRASARPRTSLEQLRRFGRQQVTKALRRRNRTKNANAEMAPP
jgi:hypothetical protein